MVYVHEVINQIQLIAHHAVWWHVNREIHFGGRFLGCWPELNISYRVFMIICIVRFASNPFIVSRWGWE